MPCEFSNTKICKHRQQVSLRFNTTLHYKAENLKIQHINSYLFLWTATYYSLSTKTFDLIHCPEQKAWTEKQQNRYLCNIYIHAQDGKNFREFSLKIKTYFRSTLFYFVKRIDQKHVFQHHTVNMWKMFSGIQIDDIKNISMTLILYQNKNVIKDVKRFLNISIKLTE